MSTFTSSSDPHANPGETKGNVAEAIQIVRTTAADIAEHAKSGIEKVSDKIVSTAADAKDAAVHKAEEFRGRAEEVLEDAKGYAKSAQHEAKIYFVDHPFTSLGVALAAGVVLGLMVQRSTHRW